MLAAERRIGKLESLPYCKNWTLSQGCVDIKAGEADLAGQIKALAAEGYAGYFTIEPHRWDERAAATRRDTAQILELLKEAGQ